ncbi:hypothetical protein ACI65C_000370 [Semiaphis heraclei]
MESVLNIKSSWEHTRHTQLIEGLWRIIKSKYNIFKIGASPLPYRQLQVEWWRSFQNPKKHF